MGQSPPTTYPQHQKGKTKMNEPARTDHIQSLIRAFALGLMDRVNCIHECNPHPAGTATAVLYTSGYKLDFYNIEATIRIHADDALDPTRPITLQLWPTRSKQNA